MIFWILSVTICAYFDIFLLEHTHKSLVSSFFSPDGAANHWFDQMTGDSIVCGNWFFHMSGLYSFALAAIYGITLYTQSDYSDSGLLETVVENKVNTVTMYSWQVRILARKFKSFDIFVRLFFDFQLLYLDHSHTVPNPHF